MENWRQKLHIYIYIEKGSFGKPEMVLGREEVVSKTVDKIQSETQKLEGMVGTGN